MPSVKLSVQSEDRLVAKGVDLFADRWRQRTRVALRSDAVGRQQWDTLIEPLVAAARVRDAAAMRNEISRALKRWFWCNGIDYSYLFQSCETRRGPPVACRDGIALSFRPFEIKTVVNLQETTIHPCQINAGTTIAGYYRQSLPVISATCWPWNRAMASSFSLGWREPSPLARVVAPYGVPPEISDMLSSRGSE